MKYNGSLKTEHIIYHHKHPDIAALAKNCILRWSGHMWKREGNACVNQGIIDNRRPLGRPRMRWKNIVIKGDCQTGNYI